MNFDYCRQTTSSYRLQQCQEKNVTGFKLIVTGGPEQIAPL